MGDSKKKNFKMESNMDNDLVKQAARKALNKRAGVIGSAGKKIKDFANKFRFSSQGAKAVGEAPKGAEAASMGMPKMIGALVAAVGINEFIGQMISWGKKKKVEMESPKYYRKMIKANPQLMEEDPETVMELWNTLYHHSTHMAKDPIAAGAFITQSIDGRVREEFGGPSPDTYSTLNNIESSAVSNNEKKFDSGKSLTDTLLTGIGIMA